LILKWGWGGYGGSALAGLNGMKQMVLVRFWASQNLEKQAEEEEAMASNIPFEERNGK